MEDGNDGKWDSCSHPGKEQKEKSGTTRVRQGLRTHRASRFSPEGAKPCSTYNLAASKVALVGRAGRSNGYPNEQCSKRVCNQYVNADLVCTSRDSLARLLSTTTPASNITVTFDLNNNIHVFALQIVRHSSSDLVKICML